MSWFLLSLLSVIFYSLSTIVQRKLMKNVNSDPVAYMIVFQFLVTAMILTYMLTANIPFPNIIGVWKNLIISGVLVSLGSVTMFQALKYTQAGEYTIISTFSAFINLIISFLFLKEIVTMSKLIGTLLVVSSILLVTNLQRSNGNFRLNKGHIYSLVSAICFGSAFANDSFIAGQLGVIPCLLVIFFIPGLFVLLLRPRAILNMPKLFSYSNLIKICTYSLLYLLGAVTIFAAYTTGGDAGKIYGISNSSVILTVILAAIFLGEKDKPFRKVIAAVTAFAGVMFLR